MTSRRNLLQLLLVGGAASALGGMPTGAKTFEVTHTDEEWRRLLSPDAYRVLRQQWTELPNSSPLLKEHRKGTFACAGCALPLFSSSTKCESGTGWPSFWAPLPNAIETTTDGSWIMTRTEVHCRRC